jgi:hypothetical protein
MLLAQVKTPARVPLGVFAGMEEFNQVLYGDFKTRANIDGVAFIILLRGKCNSLRGVFHIKEFTGSLARTPNSQQPAVVEILNRQGFPSFRAFSIFDLLFSVLMPVYW